MKAVKALLASSIFIFSIFVFYYVHINYFKIDVVFYAAIFDCFLAAVFTGVILFRFSFFHLFCNFEKSQLVAIWLILGYALAISVPTVIDRSLSFYILEKIQQRGGGIRQDAFEQIFTTEYMKEHRLIDVRLTEQLESGTIEIKSDCVLLTPKGRMISSFSRSFRQHWLPKKRLLMGEYSDTLTDPFRASRAEENYSCKG